MQWSDAVGAMFNQFRNPNPISTEGIDKQRKQKQKHGDTTNQQ